MLEITHFRSCTLLFGYSEEDFDWAANVLGNSPEDLEYSLETKHGFKLLEQHRDFIPGTIKMMALQNAIEHSRRMIVVISRQV